jgi:hypothetical protein
MHCIGTRGIAGRTNVYRPIPSDINVRGCTMSFSESRRARPVPPSPTNRLRTKPRGPYKAGFIDWHPYVWCKRWWYRWRWRAIVNDRPFYKLACRIRYASAKEKVKKSAMADQDTNFEFVLQDIQSDQQESKSRVLPHLLFYRNICRRLIRHFYILAVHTRFVGCLPLKNLLLMTFINFL